MLLDGLFSVTFAGDRRTEDTRRFNLWWTNLSNRKEGLKACFDDQTYNCVHLIDFTIDDKTGEMTITEKTSYKRDLKPPIEINKKREPIGSNY